MRCGGLRRRVLGVSDREVGIALDGAKTTGFMIPDLNVKRAKTDYPTVFHALGADMLSDTIPVKNASQE